MWHFLPVRGRRGGPSARNLTMPIALPPSGRGAYRSDPSDRLDRSDVFEPLRSCAPPFHGDMVKNHNDPLSPEEATHGSAVREARAVEVGLRPFPAPSAADDGRRAAGPGGDPLARRPARGP